MKRLHLDLLRGGDAENLDTRFAFWFFHAIREREALSAYQKDGQMPDVRFNVPNFTQADMAELEKQRSGVRNAILLASRVL